MPANRIAAIASVLTVRRASFLTLAIAAIAPAGWAYYQTRAFEKVVPAPACGMPIVAIWFFALACVAILSVTAAALNLASFLRLASPVSRARKFELAAFMLLALPALIGFALLLFT